MRDTLSQKLSKSLVLLACTTLLGASSGCSLLDALGPLQPLVKMGYNMFATIVNSALFGGTTSTGLTL